MNRHFVPACSGSRNDSATRAPNVPAGLALAGLLAAVLLVAGHLQASAVTYTVCPSGCNYPTIQAAVTAVPASRTQPITILVSAGTYRERVRVNNKLGTASNTLVIQAQGADTLDGSDLYPTSLWTLYNTGPVYWATYTPISLMSPPKSQVFVNGVRYTYVSGSSYGAPEPVNDFETPAS